MIRGVPRVAALSLVLLLTTGCRPTSSQISEDPTASIQARNEAWLAAAARRDLDGMMAIYAPDARELLPDMPPLVGRDGIRAFYQDVLEQFPRFAHHFEPEAMTVARSADLVVARGSYRFTPDTLVPGKVHDGKYVGVWRRDDSDWHLIINISNRNEPTPPE